MNRLALTYMYVVAATFWSVAVLLAVADPGQITHNWAAWLPLLGLAMIAEAFEVGAQDGEGGDVMSFSPAAHVAAVILFGPVVAGLLAGLAVVFVDGLRSQRPAVIAVNSAMYGWASMLAGFAYLLAGGHVGTVGATWGVALGAVVLARFAINAVVYAVGAALAGSVQMGRSIREALVGGAATGLGEGSLGVLLAAGWTAERWITLPFLIPLFAALYASKSNFERLRRETSAALTAFARVIDERDPNTARHTERVAEYVERFLAAIGVPGGAADRLVAAAKYHDLGKIAVDEATLSKSGRLSEPELRTIRRHPRLSAQLLAPFGFAEAMARYVELHHERFDGLGYYSVPAGQIPVEAHVLVVADSFDAMTSVRPYRPALSQAEAIQELLDKAGTQFHPLVARAFVATIEGRDVREALTAAELSQLVGSFERISTAPARSLGHLTDLRVVLACWLGTAMIVLARLPEGWPRAATAGVAGVVGAALAARLVRQRRRVRRGIRALDDGGSLDAALAAVGISGRTAWLGWDTTLHAYTTVDDCAAEACARAGGANQQCPIALSDGSYLVLGPETPERQRVAVVTAARPTRVDADLIRQLSAQVRAPLLTGPERAMGSDDAAEEAKRTTLTVELRVFERIRTTAGQLAAQHVVAEARRTARATIQDAVAVETLADDVLVVAVDAPSAKHAHLVIRRLERALAAVPVPQRAEPLAPTIRVAHTPHGAPDPAGAALLARLTADGPDLRAVGM